MLFRSASRGPFRLKHKSQGPSHIHIPKGKHLLRCLWIHGLPLHSKTGNQLPSPDDMVCPGFSSLKNLPASAGDPDSILGSRRSPGESNGNPLQYSCLGNPVDRGTWWATVHEVVRIGHNLATKSPPIPCMPLY